MRYSLSFTLITTLSITNTECSFKVKTKQYHTTYLPNINTDVLVSMEMQIKLKKSGE